MFNMQDMVADMLKKSIPPEVMAMLTPEKLKEIGEKANAFVTDIRQSLDYIKVQNATTHELQNAILAKLEATDNDDGNSESGNSEPRGRKPRSRGSRTSDVNGDGSAAG